MTRKNTARKVEKQSTTAPRQQPPPFVVLPGDEAFGSSPPLASKTHPRGNMADAVPSLDDEHRHEHHHPGDAATLTFSFDPETGDAAADLACELGSQVVEGATRVEDMSDRFVVTEFELEGLAMIIDDELGEADENDEAPPRSAPRPTTARSYEDVGDDDDDDGDG